MPPGLRLTRSHITSRPLPLHFPSSHGTLILSLIPEAIHAHLNPFHAPTSRPIQLLLSLIATPQSTQDRPAPPAKSAPGSNVNVLVDILPRTTKSGKVVVGYADGKTETVLLEPTTVEGGAGKSKFPRVRRKQEQAMPLGKLVERVDGWARVLKAREEGVQ